LSDLATRVLGHVTGRIPTTGLSTPRATMSAGKGTLEEAATGAAIAE